MEEGKEDSEIFRLPYLATIVGRCVWMDNCLCVGGWKLSAARLCCAQAVISMVVLACLFASLQIFNVRLKYGMYDST